MLNSKPFVLYVCSFFIPVAVLFLIYCQLNIGPYGDKTILISDLSGQYVDYYSSYYQILSERKSLLYSWQAGLGLNLLGIFSYYLASPFSLLILLAGQDRLPESLLLITLLKVGCCGLSFAFSAKRIFKITHGPLFIFATLYALCSYTIVYSFDLMWLDGVFILPLLILGVDKILKEHKFLLFFFSLLYILVANFYIAYMIALFSCFYFLAAYFSAHSWREIRHLLSKLKLFAGSAVLAAGCAAIVLLPTFFALLNGQGGPDPSICKWCLNFKLLDLGSKISLGAYDSLKSQGLPNIYCGLLPLILSLLYFLNTGIRLKERLIYAALVGFMVISFAFSNINLAWHGFDHPNWFPYRYSFVFSFLLVFLAAKGFSQLEQLPVTTIIKAGGFWALVMLILQKMNYPYLQDMLLMLSAFFIIFYALLLAALGKFKPPKSRSGIIALLIILVLVESLLNCRYLVSGLDHEFTYVSKDKYQRVLPELRTVITQIHSQDQAFYRLDRIGGRTYNDPMNLNYKGITHFSSMAKADLNKTLHQLGFLTTASYKSINFAGSTPLTESLLAVKYVVSADHKGLGYIKVIDGEDFAGYKNMYALPIAFLTDESLLTLDSTKDNNPFRLQNTLFNLALGNEERINFFLPLEVMDLEQEKNLDGSVEYTLLNPENQQVYACFHTINDETCRIFLNEKEIKEYLPIYNKRIVDLGFHEQGAELKVKVSCASDNFYLKEKYFYGLNELNLAKAIAPLQAGTIQDLVATETLVQGKVNVQDKTLLFTSIPYDPGWKVFVDGQKTAPSVIDNAFLGVKLKPGVHQIALVFRPQGFYAGLGISGLSVAITVVLLIFRKFKKVS